MQSVKVYTIWKLNQEWGDPAKKMYQMDNVMVTDKAPDFNSIISQVKWIDGYPSVMIFVRDPKEHGMNVNLQRFQCDFVVQKEKPGHWLGIADCIHRHFSENPEEGPIHLLFPKPHPRINTEEVDLVFPTSQKRIRRFGAFSSV